ncbi:Hint domain-containing protein [Pseudoxanthobacter sp. M-2]|uniref:Hint domain-containing protein n=1 Tax=Pseudoxanthobacter sp. M-2 TaxID=3078754 RepID=UPI0038FD180D
MAEFSSEYRAIYVGGEIADADFYNFNLSNGDDESDTFIRGETIYLTGDGSGIARFFGSTTIDGKIYVVLDPGGSTKYLFGSSAADFPTLFDSLNINTDPFTVCFLAGTMVATPVGEKLVDNLVIGDIVLTADGRPAPVKWVGVQTVVTLFADPLRSFPIRVSAGALGEGLPVRDLLVSPDHALMLDGLLVQAGALVNGSTIVREAAMPERFTYFHIELEDHALILAEGVPAETFVDNVTRRRFDNYAEYEALYGGTDPLLAELNLPRVKSARQLPQAIRRRLADRAAGITAVASTAA